MKKIDKPGVRATLAKFNQARELICYGTAGLERLRDALGNPDPDEELTAEDEIYGGGGTDLRVGLRAFIERISAPIDLLVIVSDCLTPWPEETPPFPVITIRVGDGAPPPWGTRGANKVITIEETET